MINPAYPRAFYEVSHFLPFGKADPEAGESAAETILGNREEAVDAEAGFCKTGYPLKGAGEGRGTEPQVDRRDQGLPMSIRHINFPVAGMVRLGGFG